ncbi:hypothetical protein CGLO_00067 [Colletotrichum gloeosporioides Cg-14]|uniref:Uncharacterized protein n=1 Tax=Colletotrichum gloeosporioides (strain Cg-14) TaxID=1237896 RepID=T0MEL7_COLGC|nr:hypothetical protein CGLO_00067 [Colletotrichum gloeosporioides Cg-14]
MKFFTITLMLFAAVGLATPNVVTKAGIEERAYGKLDPNPTVKRPPGKGIPH